MLKLFIPEYENRDKCESLGTLELICGLQNPEDFAKIPHENAVIVSQFAGLAELNEGEIKTGVLSRLDLDTKEIEDYLIRFEPNNKLGIGEENCEPYEYLYPHGIDIYKDIVVKDSSFSPFLLRSNDNAPAERKVSINSKLIFLRSFCSINFF